MKTTYQEAKKGETSTLTINSSVEGETIEQKMERIVNNKEPIKDGAPLVFTERKEGVRASTNIRTDRFEVAIEATTKIAGSYQARRENKGIIDINKGKETEEKDSKIGEA